MLSVLCRLLNLALHVHTITKYINRVAAQLSFMAITSDRAIFSVRLRNVAHSIFSEEKPREEQKCSENVLLVEHFYDLIELIHLNRSAFSSSVIYNYILCPLVVGAGLDFHFSSVSKMSLTSTALKCLALHRVMMDFYVREQ